jgi:hypothetical protein
VTWGVVDELDGADLRVLRDPRGDERHERVGVEFTPGDQKALGASPSCEYRRPAAAGA